MSASEDTERARLDAVAGVSRSRPEMKYTVEGLSFGAATLTREADGRWSTLTLSLTEEAAASTAAPTEREVSVEVRYWLSTLGSLRGEDAERFEGLRSLLVEHHLLSRPRLLLRADGGAPIEGAALKALDAVREMVARVQAHFVNCPVCDDPVAAQRHRFLQGRLGRGAPPMGSGWRRGVVDCAHAAMRDKAFAALFAAHPELAFEAARVLVPSMKLDPPRFVLNRELLAPLLGHWLMRRARSRYGGLDYGYGYGYRRGAEQRKMSRVPRGTALSPALRGALHYAAQSWEASGPLESFAPPTTDAAEGMPTMTSSSEPIDVAVMWPEGVARPAPKPERAAKAPAKRTAPSAKVKPAKAKAATTEEAVVKAPAPGQMLMTAELRALGYSDAKVKSLLAAGTIERAGYGWFRWKG
ncbi:MAG: hypothetical protein R3A52_23555 [Polyangiales bacterium]